MTQPNPHGVPCVKSAVMCRMTVPISALSATTMVVVAMKIKTDRSREITYDSPAKQFSDFSEDELPFFEIHIEAVSVVYIQCFFTIFLQVCGNGVCHKQWSYRSGMTGTREGHFSAVSTLRHTRNLSGFFRKGESFCQIRSIRV